VFWATGKGKSLCYQIPALAAHSQMHPACRQEQVVIVVSPLISLMQDQVHKINGLGEDTLANYLGSGQTDTSVEARALKGEFCLLYITPEKLASGSFMDKLAHMHNTVKPVALFAIDEAHCVSEWGHDFRPEFRNIGSILRGGTSSLSQVPILSLTATAVPRVQADIVQSLNMKNPFKALESFDRSNLKIQVNKKSGSMLTALLPLINALKSTTRKSQQSTIVYAASRSQVEEIASLLQDKISNDVTVEAYHAGFTPTQRHNVHTNFLTGRTSVIVATVAFGMGIDKPDTRRVVHYGPPKTMEEYYQQIGRAGRDGLPSECEMIVTESDFAKYQGEFYLGNLHGKALEATKSSMKALREFALDGSSCRRYTLLSYFGQVPSFGKQCMTCDNCLKIAKYGPDTDRDFGPIGARQVLLAVASLKSQSSSALMDVIMGKMTDDYRYCKSKTDAKKNMDSMLKEIPKIYPKQQYFKELLRSLIDKGLVTEALASANVRGFNRSWSTYTISMRGASVLKNETAAISLPIPDCVRAAEEKEAARRKETMAKIKASGLSTEKIPQDELAKGDGKTVQAFKKWVDYVELQRNNGRTDRVNQLETLLKIVEEWRSMAAVKHRMATGSVMTEETMVSVAYAQATLPPGRKLDRGSLVAAGVRSKEVTSLAASLGSWVDQCQPAVQTQSGCDPSMVFPKGGILAAKAWEFAVYKKKKSTGMATWESSYLRFLQGESPETIAMSPESGRPIQAKTVVSHILDALTHGRQVDAARLTHLLPPPSENEWKQFEDAEASTGMNAAGNPDSSGMDGGKFIMTDFLKPIIGSALAEKNYSDRSDAEKEIFSKWCDKLKWYQCLRKVGYKPSFQ